MKKLCAWMLVLAMVLTMSACGSKENAVFVQPVKDLMNMGGIAPGDRFAGIVVSENITEIQKDSQMVVEELLVKEGDDVEEGQTLFSYDTQQLQLSLDKLTDADDTWSSLSCKSVHSMFCSSLVEVALWQPKESWQG